MSPREILCRFTSIGDNCEFGLAQSNFGFQPFSLFAFALNTLDGLALALSDGLREIADPAKFEIAPSYQPNHKGTREYMLTHKTYGSIFHTAGYEGQHDPQELMKASMDRLAYLRDEFIDDMRRGDRIAVFKTNQRPPFDAIRNLQKLILDNYGPTRLLWVAVAERSELIGAVHPVGDILLKGYVGWFAKYEEATKFAAAEWLKLCTNTVDLLESNEARR